MDFREERTMILEMIANGKVTVEEGEELAIYHLAQGVPRGAPPGDEVSQR